MPEELRELLVELSNIQMARRPTDPAKKNSLCYSTWYGRVRSGKTPLEAASYPPCPIKGRKMTKKGE